MCHNLARRLYIFATTMDILYKNKILSPAERAETISRIDQLVSQYEESIKEYRAREIRPRGENYMSGIFKEVRAFFNY